VILVDTSIWIDHFRHQDALLASMLDARRVLAHPFVIGELALGTMTQRDFILARMHRLPRAIVASDVEMLRFIDQQTLSGSGIGYVDAHLLAAARLTNGATLWTRDKRLDAAARRLSLAARVVN
jgi:predicted nucleic acid-binding protein